MSSDEKHAEDAPPIVTHVTEVKIRLSLFWELSAEGEPLTPRHVRQAGEHQAAHYRRLADMMDLLASHGFSFLASKKFIHAYSRQVEAGEIKRHLLAAGFNDREFQIVLEYTRGWGML